MRGPSFDTPIGRAQPHFYQNLSTGEVNYAGAKSVLNATSGKQWIVPTLEKILEGLHQ